ncbi:MAG: hypothetical protein IJP30_03465 [Clostridia bacterium]|nr:hypothetical protein [Clostridia bacterium]
MALFGKKNNNNSGYRRVDQPRQRSRKEILIELIICFVILALYAGRDVFFPNWDIFNERGDNATPTPTATVQPMNEVNGTGALTLDALNKVDVTMPEGNGKWRVYVFLGEEKTGYALVSYNEVVADEAALTQGYSIAASGVRVYTEDTEVLAALFKKIPTGDAVTVYGAGGAEVDARLFAVIADGARKGGQSIELAKPQPTPAVN